MARICYVEKQFNTGSLAIIAQANEIIDEYTEQGFELTLRQLYYQFVARDLLANTQREYKRLGSIINNGRLAGRIDWDSLVDRTRNLQSLAHWNSTSEIIDACANQYRIDKWETQDIRPEIWIEKDALTGVIAGTCEDFDVSYFSCRGYTSQSEMWGAAQRMIDRFDQNDQPTLLIHLGDHDPSGLDMTRDITDRLDLFGANCEVKRIALNMDQIDEFNPPPNPAKLTDSRCAAYITKIGYDSWELDALEPMVLAELVKTTIQSVLDPKKWKVAEAQETAGRIELAHVSEQLKNPKKPRKPRKKKRKGK